MILRPRPLRLRPLRRLPVPLLVGLTLLGCSSSGSGQGDDRSARTSPEIGRVEVWDGTDGWRPADAAPDRAPQAAWRVPVRRDDDGGYAVARGRVFVATRPTPGGPASVTRIDPADGSEVWGVEVDVDGPVSIEADPTGTVVELVTGTDPETEPGNERRTVLDAETGAAVWPGSDDDILPARAVDDLVLVTSGEVNSAVDRPSGEVRWTSERFLTVSDGQILAEEVGALIDGAEVSEVAVLDPATGQERWHLERPAFGDVQVVGDTVVLTHDRPGPQDRATAFDLADGRERWQVDIPPVGRARAQALDDDTVLLSGLDGSTGLGVVVLNVERGAELWSATGTSVAVLRVDGEARALLARDGAAELLDGRTGEVLQSRSAPTLPSPDAVADGLAYRSAEGVAVAIALPGLADAWQVATSSEVLEGTVPGGFVTSDLGTDGQPGELVGYLG